MKGKDIIVPVAIGIGVLFIFWSTANAQAANMIFDFASLDNSYPANDVNRLIALYQVLATKGLSVEQIKYMLSQALQETGLFTDVANYNNMDTLHNYAGIMGNSRYPAGSGSQYAAYPNLNAFVDDWIYLLNKGTYPLDAVSISDFNNRLKANGYYTDSSGTYGANLASYYNLLNSIAVNA